jgi:hypothetical protein
LLSKLDIPRTLGWFYSILVESDFINAGRRLDLLTEQWKDCLTWILNGRAKHGKNIHSGGCASGAAAAFQEMHALGWRPEPCDSQQFAFNVDGV